jgi:voltage-gated potassium channel
VSSGGREPSRKSFREELRLLYYGRSRKSRLFRYGLVAFDIFSIIYFIGLSFVEQLPVIIALDILVGLVIVADLLARYSLASRTATFFSDLTNWADLIVAATLFAPLFFQDLLFLRALRALRLLRSYHLLRDLKSEITFVRRNEELIQAILNVVVFLFVTTSVVFVQQKGQNSEITSWVDALYFTVTTLTTTGFGDITLKGELGRLLAIVIMVVGIGLFLRMLQAVFRPTKVEHRCPDCGLNRHDLDAVHCKACGKVLNIEDEGAT